jgi:molybdenum cofactor cytidylyltransferase
MGRPKASLDWGGKTLLQHQIDVLTESGCDPVIVVLGSRAHQLRARIDCAAPCRVIENAAYRSGRASSIRVGVQHIPDDVGAIVVASVDSPLSSETVANLVASWDEEPPAILVPRFEGRNGHPALFSGELLSDLRTVQESTLGLKAVRDAHRDATRFLDVDDALTTQNLNTPEDYATAVTRWFPPHA